MFTHLDSYLNSGGSFICLSGNTAFWNTEILEDGSFKSAIGKAYQRKINPAALRVSFYGPFYFGTYNVVETDYEDYSVVYSC